MKVEGMVASSPGDGALFGARARLIGLALNAQVHNVISANSAVIHLNIPGPKRYGVPLGHSETCLAHSRCLLRGGKMKSARMLMDR